MAFNFCNTRFFSNKKTKKVGYYSPSLMSFIVLENDEEESSINIIKKSALCTFLFYNNKYLRY